MMGITVYRCQQIKENNWEQSTVFYVISVQSLKPATLRYTLIYFDSKPMERYVFFLWHFSLSSLWKCCPIYCWLQIAVLHGRH